MSSIGFFADGIVGRRIVDYMNTNEHENVSFVVYDEKSSSMDVQDLVARLGRNRVMSWTCARTQDGLNQLRSLKASVVLLAWWPYLIQPDHINLGTSATLNLHPSFLPFCRGKDPNFWAIANKQPFGVTIHHVVAAMDAGPIAFQKEIGLTWEDTGGSAYEKAINAIFTLFVDNVREILTNRIPSQLQNDDIATTNYRKNLAPKSRLQLSEKFAVGDLLNLLRARTFPGMPACNFEDAGQTYEVRVEITKSR